MNFTTTWNCVLVKQISENVNSLNLPNAGHKLFPGKSTVEPPAEISVTLWQRLPLVPRDDLPRRAGIYHEAKVAASGGDDGQECILTGGGCCQRVSCCTAEWWKWWFKCIIAGETGIQIDTTTVIQEIEILRATREECSKIAAVWTSYCTTTLWLAASFATMLRRRVFVFVKVVVGWGNTELCIVWLRYYCVEQDYSFFSFYIESWVIHKSLSFKGSRLFFTLSG